MFSVKFDVFANRCTMKEIVCVRMCVRACVRARARVCVYVCVRVYVCVDFVCVCVVHP